VKKAQVKLSKYTTGKICAGGSGTRNLKLAEGKMQLNALMLFDSFCRALFEAV